MSSSEFRIRVPGKRSGTEKWISVPGHATRSEYFAVTARVRCDSRHQWTASKRSFSLTHIPTGCRAVPKLRTIRQGQLIAAILHALPIKWGKVRRSTSEKARRGLDKCWIDYIAYLQVEK